MPKAESPQGDCAREHTTVRSHRTPNTSNRLGIRCGWIITSSHWPPVHNRHLRPEPRPAVARRSRRAPVARKSGGARPQTRLQSPGSTTHPFMQNEDTDGGSGEDAPAFYVTIYAYYICISGPKPSLTRNPGSGPRILGGPVFGHSGFEPPSICLLHNLYAVVN